MDTGDLMLGSSWNASTSEARPFIAPRSLSDESKDPVRNADWVQVLKGYVAVTVMDVNYAASRRSELARREALLAPLLTKRVASTLAVCEDRVNTATTIPPTPATAFKVLNILIVNDDGCGTEKPTSAEVLLQKLTAAGHKAIVVAPYTDQSGTSASFSYRAPWAVTEPRPNVFCVRGLTGENTPVDAANVGISMMKARNGGAAPDLVVSGINPGENVGFLQTISGTIGATTFTVRQAGIPAIAISTSVDLRTGIAPEWVASAGDFLVQLVETLRKSTPAGDGIPQMSPPLWLAVNFPTRTLAAVSNVQVTTQERAFRFELLAKYNATTGDADANIYGLSAGKDPNGDVFVTASGGISISILDGDLGVGKCSNEYGRIKSVLQPALRKYRRRLARSRR